MKRISCIDKFNKFLFNNYFGNGKDEMKISTNKTISSRISFLESNLKAFKFENRYRNNR
jgi:hypothetical protein